MEKYLSRFWEKVEIPPQKDGRCWLWMGDITTKGGYGVFRPGVHLVGETRAHRISYSLHYGEEWDKSLFVCHACDTPQCVNPHHLWLGSHSENMMDCIRKDRHLTRRSKFARIPPEKIEVIRNLRGHSIRSISREVSLSTHLVKKVLETL